MRTVVTKMATACICVAAIVPSSMAQNALVTDYWDLLQNDVYSPHTIEILGDGSVVIVVQNENFKLPTHICHLHRQLGQSFDDECRVIGR